MSTTTASIACDETEIESSKREPVKRAQSESPVSRTKSPAIAVKKACGDKRSQSLSHVKGRRSTSTRSSNIAFGRENSSSYVIQREHTLLPMSQSMLVKTIKTLATKKRDFFRLRKSYITQQKEFIQQYSALRELEERAGIKESTLGDVRLVSVDTWRAHDLLLLVTDDQDHPVFTDVEGDFAPQVLRQLQLVVDSIRNDLLSVCSELMTSRGKLIDAMRTMHRSDRTAYISKSEWKARNTKINNETEELQNLLHTATNSIETKITKALQIAKTPWIDRDNWFIKIEAAQRENLQLQQKIDELSKQEKMEQYEMENNNSSSDLRVRSLNEELSKERSARDLLKEGLTTAENLLRVARARIADLKKQLKETQAELETARRKFKDQELLNRHRQLHLDAKSRKLREVSKTGEAAYEALVQQRDALELRVKELRDKVGLAEQDLEMKLSELRAKSDSLQAKLAEQEKVKAAVENKAKEYEAKADKLEKHLQDMREYSAKLVSIEKKHCLDYVPTKESEPSTRETEIWKELSVTRSALSRAEHELRESRADKENFLNTLNKIAQEQGDAKHNRLASELLVREKKILEMQKSIEDSNLNEKLLEQKLSGHERELSSLRLEVAKLRNYDYFSKTTPHQELQIMLMELHMQVETLIKERTELVTAAASRALMLERHERGASLFCKMTRARRELAACLGGAEEPVRLDDVQAEISRSLSCVCSNAAETWTALNAERTRVIHLESAVVAQNLQLKREASLRVQLEQIRSVLERNIRHQYLTAHTSVGRIPR